MSARFKENRLNFCLIFLQFFEMLSFSTSLFCIHVSYLSSNLYDSVIKYEEDFVARHFRPTDDNLDNLPVILQNPCKLFSTKWYLFQLIQISQLYPGPASLHVTVVLFVKFYSESTVLSGLRSLLPPIFAVLRISSIMLPNHGLCLFRSTKLDQFCVMCNILFVCVLSLSYRIYSVDLL